MYRDGARKSIWQDEIRKFSTENDLSQWFDTVIVGGGITGVSTALKLQESGQKCIIIEAANIGFGTTGGTTAHLNDFFDTTFAQAIKDFGLDADVAERSDVRRGGGQGSRGARAERAPADEAHRRSARREPPAGGGGEGG